MKPAPYRVEQPLPDMTLILHCASLVMAVRTAQALAEANKRKAQVFVGARVTFEAK